MSVRGKPKDTTPPELLAAVVADAPIVLFALDAEGRFTLSQGRGLDALGLRPDEVVGRRVEEVYAGHPSILDNCRKALAGEPVRAVVTLNGLAFEVSYAPIPDWGGRIKGVIGVAVDVTDSYRSRLARDEFLSVISHELRTPLSSALGWSHMLADGALDRAEARKAVDTIRRNLEDLNRLIGELRDASQAATGRLALASKPCDLGAAVREAAKAVAPAAEAKGLVLRVRAPALKARADKARLRQVAWILLSNAVKFSPKGGTIEAALEAAGAEAVLTVRDEGPGIPDDQRAAVFDLPRPAGREGGARHRGLGLGLAVARRIVELHGGRLEALDSPSGGALLAARLPLRPARH